MPLSAWALKKTFSYLVDIVVKNKSHVIYRCLYSCRQRYVSSQWSKCCATNWATSQSARFALVIEYVSSIHPWANSRCWTSQSERALCFSYVITQYSRCLVLELSCLYTRHLQVRSFWISFFLSRESQPTWIPSRRGTKCHPCTTEMTAWQETVPSLLTDVLLSDVELLFLTAVFIWHSLHSAS